MEMDKMESHEIAQSEVLNGFNKNEKVNEEKQPFIKQRYVQVLLLFLMAVNGGFRLNLSVAIVAMTTANTSSNPDVPVFDWNNTSIILSSYYWTYFITQLFCGYLALSHGPKWYIFGAMSMHSLAFVLIPILSVTSLGANGVMGCRMVQGLCLGVMVPLIAPLLGRWAPDQEASWMNSFIYTGFYVGTIIAYSTTGLICASWVGWPASFYLFGGTGFIWCVLWMFLGFNSPAEHPRISSPERKYIEVSLGHENHVKISLRTPWKSIFTSLPVWAIIVASTGESWGGTLLSTEMPTYLSKTTNINIASSGIFSSLSYVVAAITTFVCGPISTFLIGRGLVSTVNTRRIFQIIGSLTPGVSLLWLAYVPESVALASTLLIIALGASTAVTSGHVVNVIDISSRYSGVIWGIANGIGQGIAILAPVVVHFVVTDQTDKTLWRIMFILASAIYFGGALFFVLCLSGQKQSWDNDCNKTTDDSTKEPVGTIKRGDEEDKAFR